MRPRHLTVVSAPTPDYVEAMERALGERGFSTEVINFAGDDAIRLSIADGKLLLVRHLTRTPGYYEWRVTPLDGDGCSMVDGYIAIMQRRGELADKVARDVSTLAMMLGG